MHLTILGTSCNWYNWQEKMKKDLCNSITVSRNICSLLSNLSISVRCTLRTAEKGDLIRLTNDVTNSMYSSEKIKLKLKLDQVDQSSSRVNCFESKWAA